MNTIIRDHYLLCCMIVLNRDGGVRRDSAESSSRLSQSSDVKDRRPTTTSSVVDDRARTMSRSGRYNRDVSASRSFDIGDKRTTSVSRSVNVVVTDNVKPSFDNGFINRHASRSKSGHRSRSKSKSIDGNDRYTSNISTRPSVEKSTKHGAEVSNGRSFY